MHNDKTSFFCILAKSMPYSFSNFSLGSSWALMEFWYFNSPGSSTKFCKEPSKFVVVSTSFWKNIDIFRWVLWKSINDILSLSSWIRWGAAVLASFDSYLSCMELGYFRSDGVSLTLVLDLMSAMMSSIMSRVFSCFWYTKFLTVNIEETIRFYYFFIHYKGW